MSSKHQTKGFEQRKGFMNLLLYDNFVQGHKLKSLVENKFALRNVFFLRNNRAKLFARKFSYKKEHREMITAYNTNRKSSRKSYSIF